MDLTGDSVTAETLAEGATAHDAAGNPITGTMKSDTANVYVGEEEPTDENVQVWFNPNGNTNIETITDEAIRAICT